MSCTYFYNGNEYTRTQLIKLLDISRQYPKGDIGSAKQWLIDTLGMNEHQILSVKGLIDFGSFGRLLSDGRILLSEQMPEGTEYHEGFHRVFRMLANDAQRQAIYEEFRNREGSNELIEKKRKIYPELSEEDLIEEIVADEFMMYNLSPKEYTSTPLIQKFFKWLRNFFNNLLNNPVTLKEFYEKINSGEFKGKPELVYQVRPADMLKVGGMVISPEKKQEIFGSISVRLLNKIFDNTSITIYDVIKDNVDVTSLLRNSITGTLKALPESERELAEAILNDAYTENNQLNPSSDFIKEFNKYFETYGATLNVEEDVQIEDKESDEEVNARDYSFMKVSFEFDPKSSMSRSIKLLLSSLIQKDNTGDNIGSSILGLVQPVKLSEISTLLLTNLANLPADFNVFVDRLEYLSQSHPEITQLINRLRTIDVDNIKDVDYDVLKFRNEFIQNFAKSLYDFQIGLMKKDGIVSIPAASNNIPNTVLKEFRNNIIQKYRTAQEFNEALDTPVILDIANALGMTELTESDLTNKLENNQKIQAELLVIKNVVQRSIEGGTELQNLYADNKNEDFNIRPALKRIANYIATTKRSADLNFRNAEGQQVYGISLNNYQTIVLNTLNWIGSKKITKDAKIELVREYLPGLLDANNFRDNKITSIWINKMLTGDKLLMGVYDGINGAKRKSFSDLKETDLYSFNINIPFEGTNFAVKHSSRSSIFTYRFQDRYTYVKNPDYNTQLDQAVDILYEYYLDEQNIINTVEGKRLINFGKLGKNQLNFPFVKKNQTEEEVRQAIKDNLDKKIKKFKDAAESNGVFLQQNDKPVGISKDMFDYFREGNKNSLENTNLSIAAFAYINNHITHFEEQKVLLGSTALYKNVEDEYKRLSTQSSTGNILVVDEFNNAYIEYVNNRDSREIYNPKTGKLEKFRYNKPTGKFSEFVTEEYDKYVSSMVIEDPNLISPITNKPTNQIRFIYETNLIKTLKPFLLEKGKTESQANKIISDQTDLYEEKYKEINENDGQSHLTIFASREYQHRAGIWTKEKENNFQIQLKALTLKTQDEVKDITVWVDKETQSIVKAYVEDTDNYIQIKPFDFADIQDKLEVNGQEWFKVNIEPTTPLKGQYVGNVELGVDNLNVVGIRKTSYFELQPTMIVGTNLQLLNNIMIKQGIDLHHFASSAKTGRLDVKEVNPSLTNGLQFYGNDGSFNYDTINDNMNTLKSYLDVKFMKDQLKISNKVKYDIKNSTQSAKIILSNLTTNGIPRDVPEDMIDVFNAATEEEKRNMSEFYKYIQEYKDILNELIQNNIDSLLEELRAVSNGSTYDIENFKKLTDLLKQAATDRNSPIPVLEAIERFSEDKIIESLPNKSKIENILFSIVSNRVVIFKRPGNSYAQVSITGFEKLGNRNLNNTNPLGNDEVLSFYKPEFGNKATSIKEGVDFVFKENPELSKIGTKSEYSAYLDTIFPESNIKNIVYHAGSAEDNFDRKYIGSNYSGNFYPAGLGFYFSNEFDQEYGYPKPYLLNIKKPIRLAPYNIQFEIQKLKESIKENINSPNPYRTKEENDNIQSFEKKRLASLLKFEERPTNEEKKILDRALQDKNNNVNYSFGQKEGYDGVINDLAYFPEDYGNKGEPKLIIEEIVAFENNQIYRLGSNEDIRKFKIWKEKNSSKVITKINPAEIAIPLPDKWFSYLLKRYNTGNIQKAVDLYNKDDKKILVKGLRIPNQQLSSNDVFAIKTFFVPTMETFVIVPTELVVKNGSDFDIDTAKIYFPVLTGEDNAYNELLNIEQQILLHPDNLHNLLKPLVDDKLKVQTLAEVVGQLKQGLSKADAIIAANKGDLTGKTSSDDINDLTTNINKFILYIETKAGVGMIATDITGHSIAQTDNIQLSEEFNVGTAKEPIIYSTNIPFEGSYTSSMSRMFDENGYDILESLSVALTSQVDGEKNPYATKLGLSNQTLGILTYLMRRGVPVETVIKFLSQPVLEKYLLTQRINESQTFEYNKLTKSKSDLLETYLIKQKLSKKDYDQALSDVMSGNLVLSNEYLENNIKNNISDVEALAVFNYLVDITRYFRYYKTDITADTKTLKDMSAVNTIQANYNNMMATNMVANPENSRQGVLKPFFNARDLYGELFKNLYITENFEFVNELKSMIEQYASVQNSEDDKVKVANTINNQLIAYLVQNYHPVFKERTFGSMFTGDNSLPKRINKILLDRTHPLHDNYALKNMYIELKNAEDAFTKQKVDNIRIYERSLPVVAINDIYETFYELPEDLQDDFIAMSIYQTGFNTSPYSFENILPTDRRYDIVKEALKYADTMNFSDFYNKYALNNPDQLPKTSASAFYKGFPYHLDWLNNEMVIRKASNKKGVKGEVVVRLGGSYFKVYNRIELSTPSTPEAPINSTYTDYEDNPLVIKREPKQFVWNVEQQNAINRTIQFIKEGNSKEWFLIQGKAGTGKTTIIKEVLNQFPNSSIIVGALSHKAKGVIKDSMATSSIRPRFNTIAGMLGFKLNMETGEFQDSKGAEKPIEFADIIVIDEASMVNEEALELIMSLKSKNAKVIFLGDIGQLPPIRTIQNPYYKKDNKKELFGKKSPVFTTTNTAKLITRVRQGELNPVLPFADYFWNNSQAKISVKQPATANIRTNSISNNGTLLFVNKSKDIIDETVELFKKAVKDKNPNYIKFVSYKNDTRKSINTYIHQAVFGNTKTKYVEGELIIFNDNYDKIENATEATVVGTYPTEIDSNGFKFNILDIQVEVEDNVITQSIAVLNEEDVAKHNAYISKLFTEAFALKGKSNYYSTLQDAWAEKNRYANIDYGYVITSHKSQGSTYDAVIVHEQDIMSVNATSNREKSESIYTALTRAKHLAVVISSEQVADIDIPNLSKILNRDSNVEYTDYEDVTNIPENKQLQLALPEPSNTSFPKRNLFTVTPKQSVDAKAVVKASLATQYIGFAEGVAASSTALYARQIGSKYANTGSYNSNDVIFVSVQGNRGNEIHRKKNQDKTILEVIKALESGATLLTDNKKYIDSSSYNSGEKRLYQNLEAKGYNYSEITVDNEIIGVWNKTAIPTTPIISQLQEAGVETEDVRNTSVLITSKNEKELEKVDTSVLTIQQFDELFPDYTWMNEEEKQILIKGIEAGQIEIVCKVFSL